MEDAYHHCNALPLCAMSTLADYKNNFFKQGNQQLQLAAQAEENAIEITDIDHQLKHLILTGHSDGMVLVWGINNYIRFLTEYKVPVNTMSKCYEGIAIGTIEGHIYIWDVNLTSEQRVIDINDFGFNVLSSVLVSMDYNKRRILVCTINGDIVEVALADQREAGAEAKAKRLPSVARITSLSLRAQTILTAMEQTLIVGGENGLVLSYDISTHELIDIWDVGVSVSSLASLKMDNGAFVLAAGTDDGHIHLRQGWSQDYTNPR